MMAFADCDWEAPVATTYTPAPVMLSHQRVCVECGELIVFARIDARFCGPTCRQRHGRRLIGEGGP